MVDVYVDLAGDALEVDWGLTKKTLLDYFKDKCAKEWKANKRTFVVGERALKPKEAFPNDPEGYTKARFYEEQTKKLDNVTTRTWKGLTWMEIYEKEKTIPIKVKGKPLHIRGPEVKRISIARRRGRSAPLWGYGPADTELIMNGEANLASSSHWYKASYIRWIRTYLYCEAHDLDIYNMDDWARAADVMDTREGNLSIWDVLKET
jgi:hypothetical protein